MQCYTIPHISNFPDWDSVPTLEVNNILWLPDANIRMTQQICYDKHALYVHQHAVEKHIRSEHTSPLAQVCEDSCMEFFICPDPDSNRYFNFEFNPNGCLYLGFNSGHGLSVRLQPNEPRTLFDVHISRAEDGWELYYQIPLSFIQLFFPDFHLLPGTAIRTNCYKCGDKSVQPHYLSWNLCTSETPNFHRPCDFGVMCLGS